MRCFVQKRNTTANPNGPKGTNNFDLWGFLQQVIKI